MGLSSIVHVAQSWPLFWAVQHKEPSIKRSDKGKLWIVLALCISILKNPKCFDYSFENLLMSLACCISMFKNHGPFSFFRWEHANVIRIIPKSKNHEQFCFFLCTMNEACWSTLNETDSHTLDRKRGRRIFQSFRRPTFWTFWPRCPDCFGNSWPRRNFIFMGLIWSSGCTKVRLYFRLPCTVNAIEWYWFSKY